MQKNILLLIIHLKNRRFFIYLKEHKFIKYKNYILLWGKTQILSPSIFLNSIIKN